MKHILHVKWTAFSWNCLLEGNPTCGKEKKREEVLVLTLSHPSLLSPWHTHPLTVQNLQHCHFKVSFSNGVLVSAGIKLVFFPVATMVLCSGFKVWIMLITQQRCSCCWTVLTSSPVLFGFLYCPARKELGVQNEPGQLTQNDQRDIPHHMASCSARGGRHMWSDTICLSNKLLPVISLTFWR